MNSSMLLRPPSVATKSWHLHLGGAAKVCCPWLLHRGFTPQTTTTVLLKFEKKSYVWDCLRQTRIVTFAFQRAQSCLVSECIRCIRCTFQKETNHKPRAWLQNPSKTQHPPPVLLQRVAPPPDLLRGFQGDPEPKLSNWSYTHKYHQILIYMPKQKRAETEIDLD